MASRLQNLMHTLTWNDFRGRVPHGASHAAKTAVEIVFTRLDVDRTSSGVRLRDNVVVTVALQQSQSWARQSERTTDLLHHEQGHYNVTALTARDMFIDLMQLKGRTFNGAAALQNELNRIRGLYNPQAIHDKYDARGETDHGRDSGKQRIWDGYIRQAFTQTRTPLVRAPDGATYKIRLREVLRAAGKI